MDIAETCLHLEVEECLALKTQRINGLRLIALVYLKTALLMYDRLTRPQSSDKFSIPI